MLRWILLDFAIVLGMYISSSIMFIYINCMHHLLQRPVTDKRICMEIDEGHGRIPV